MILYRYEDNIIGAVDADGNLTSTRADIQCKEYKIEKETEKGYWISLGYGDTKFMLKEAKKLFAHKTKQKALEAYIKRKTDQIDILDKKIHNVKQMRSKAQRELQNINSEYWTKRNI
ncbi:MAG: hypothetical protein ACOCP4_05615 [Candidatus Woesearchaeota archaeon]